MKPDGSDARTTRANYFELLDSFYDSEFRYLSAGGPRASADFSETAAFLHPDVVFHHGPSSPFAGDWGGIDGVQRLFVEMADIYASADDLRVERFIGDGGVAVHMSVRLTSRATGARWDAKLGQFIKFDGGLIRDFTTYYLDPIGAREACGL